jgi:branched-chain amino acid transport system substrate-binding protein
LKDIQKDCKSTADEAMSVSAALVGQKIVAQIGPLTSGDVAGSTPVLMENKIPLIAPAATAANVTVDDRPEKPGTTYSGYVSSTPSRNSNGTVCSQRPES